MPSEAHKVLFILAPLISFIPAFVTFTVVPLGPDVIIADLNIGILLSRACATTSSWRSAGRCSCPPRPQRGHHRRGPLLVDVAMTPLFFLALAAMGLVGAVMVVLQRNPVVSALYLVLSSLSGWGFQRAEAFGMRGVRRA